MGGMQRTSGGAGSDPSDVVDDSMSSAAWSDQRTDAGTNQKDRSAHRCMDQSERQISAQMEGPIRKTDQRTDAGTNQKDRSAHRCRDQSE